MSDKEKRNAIPAEGTVTEAKPAEAKKEGFFQKIGRKAKEIAAKPAVKKVAKVGLNVLMAAGLVGLGWAAHDIADGNEDNEESDETVVLTEGDYEQTSEEETDAENE